MLQTMPITNKQLQQLFFFLLISLQLFSQDSIPKLYEEKGGLLIIEMESAELVEDWRKDSTADNFTGEGYVYWSPSSYQVTGSRHLNLPHNHIARLVQSISVAANLDLL